MKGAGWDRKLWGVEFSSDKERMLIGGGWLSRKKHDYYDGEPTRAILFTTRADARKWCKAQRQKYIGRTDCCAAWRFIPFRVREKVTKISRTE